MCHDLLMQISRRPMAIGCFWLLIKAWCITSCAGKTAFKHGLPTLEGKKNP